MRNLKLFFGALLFQIIILNNIQLSGYINPYYYIIIILYLPAKNSKVTTLLLSFLTGFIMDVFCYSYGAHTFASVLIAYLKITWANRINYTKDTEELFDFKSLPMIRFIQVSIYFIMIHHFTLFLLESFSLSELFMVLKTTILSAILTLIIFIIHKIMITKQTT